MKKQDFNEAMDFVGVSEEKKNTLWSRIETSTEKKKGRIGKHVAAAALLLCVLGVSITATADEIKDFFEGYFSKQAGLEEYVRENVYEDVGEHVKFSVKEVVSNGVLAKAVLCYKGLDEEGIEWVQQLEPRKNIGEDGFYDFSYVATLIPKVAEGYGANYAYNCYEIEELRTEEEAYFEVFFRTSSGDYGTGEGVLTYQMPEKYENKTEIDVTSNVERYYYKMVSQERNSKYYTCAYLEADELTFTIKGVDLGFTEYGNIEGGGYYERVTISKEEYHNMMPEKIVLEEEDGSKTKVMSDSAFFHLARNGWVDEHGCDLIVSTGDYYDGAPEEKLVLFEGADKLEKVYLDQVEYQLIPIEK